MESYFYLQDSTIDSMQALALCRIGRERPVSHSPFHVFFPPERVFTWRHIRHIGEQNNKTVEMLVFPTNHVGVVSYVIFFLFFQ